MSGAPRIEMGMPPALASFGRSVDLPQSGVRIFLYDAGSHNSPVVLLVHGLGDEADTWRRVIGPLSSSFRVIAPDLPGFGRSLPVRRRLTPPFLARLLLELLDGLGASRAVFVGSSLGASLCQVCALRQPERVSRLVLVDGGLLVRTALPPALLLMLLPVAGEKRYRSLERNPDAAYASLIPYYASLRSLPPEEREFLRTRVGERVASAAQRRAYFSMFRGFFSWMLFNGKTLGDRAAARAVDTLYIWGARDYIIPLDAGRSAHTRHPGSRLEVIPDAGHLPHQEKPGEFLRLLS